MFFAFLAVLASQSAPPSIVVATYSYPHFDRRVALAPLAALVEQATKRRARIVLFDTPQALAQAVCNGAVDVAMTNLGAFVTMRDCRDVGAIAVLDTPAAVLENYRGVLLARGDSGVTTLAGLSLRAAQLRYTEVLPGSTSGALVQAAALQATGISPGSFAARRNAGTHEAALDDLLTGRAEVAALAEEPWRKLQAADPGRAATLRLLWRSDTLPPGPVICREASGSHCAAIRDRLLDRSAAGVAAALSKGWTETAGATGFKAYEVAKYEIFRAE